MEEVVADLQQVSDAGQAPIEFKLAESSQNTTTGLVLERVDSSDGVVVKVVAETGLAEDLLMFCLEYDPASYRVDKTVVVEFGEAVDCLTLSAVPRPGYVCFGQVRQGGGELAIPPGGVLAELRFAAGAETSPRAVAGAPISDRARTLLSYLATEGRLEFFLSNPGDYDQNGLVSVSDLAPIGQHYGKAGPFNYSSVLSVVDGNQNGLIEIGDITSIGQNWGNEVELYYIFRGESSSDYPADNGAPSTINPCKSMEISEANGIAATDRLRFTYLVPGPTGGESYWVRPVARDGGDISEGTPSEMITSSSWLMAGHDAQHTGRTNAIGPPLGELAWSYTFGIAGSTSPAFGSDGTVYVGTDRWKLYAVDPAGEIMWSFRSEGAEFAPPVVGPDGTVFSGTSDGNLYAVNPDGSLRWSCLIGGQIDGPAYVVDGGDIYIATRTGDLCAINPVGEILWTYNVERVLLRPVAGSDGTVFVLSDFDTLYALTPAGELVWEKPLSGFDARTELHLLLNGDILFGLDDQLLSITPGGTDAWSYDLGSETYTEPALLPDGTIIVGTEDKKVVAITPDGNQLWESEMAEQCVSVLVDPTRELIYACSTWEAAVLDFTGGAVDDQWLAGVYMSMPGIDPQGNIVFSSTYDGLRCFAPSGAARWDIPPGPGLSSILVTGDGNLYCTGGLESLQGEEYWIKSFSPAGDLLWTYDLPAEAGGAPAIDRSNVLYCACANRELLALSLGGELITASVMKYAATSDLVIAPDRIIYAGCNADYISGYTTDGEQVLGSRSFSSDPMTATPTVALDGTLYYVGDHDHLSAKTLSTTISGKTLWTSSSDGNLNHHAVVNSDANVFYGTSSVYAINVDGWTMWSTSLGGASLTCAMSLTRDDTLLCCCSDGYLRSIDYRGDELTGRAVEVDASYPPVIDGNGNVYVADQETMLCVNLETGQVLWSDRPGGICSTDIVLGPEGQLYLGCDDAILYAYRGPE